MLTNALAGQKSRHHADLNFGFAELRRADGVDGSAEVSVEVVADVAEERAVGNLKRRAKLFN
jgi:hypothetical protein